jgi:hypothetical protein
VQESQRAAKAGAAAPAAKPKAGAPPAGGGAGAERVSSSAGTAKAGVAGTDGAGSGGKAQSADAGKSEVSATVDRREGARLPTQPHPPAPPSRTHLRTDACSPGSLLARMHVTTHGGAAAE